ncbi:MAG TPA: PKD domain-containing protein [Candidatus Thermoplasmatota archaeon]|nr:PKD domain-containing protein [Candidatus Thermoplasmatota archaeon]
MKMNSTKGWSPVAAMLVAVGLSACLAGPTEGLPTSESLAFGASQEPSFRPLRADLSTRPGFLGLAPSSAAPRVLVAVFEEKVPHGLMPSILVPPGWAVEFVAADPPRHLREAVHRVANVDATDPGASAPVPASSSGIGPGSPMLQTIPGEGTFICTANFVFRDGAKYYLGAAGHCFLPEGKKATHGSGADYNAGSVEVEVCVASCFFGGQLTGFLGDMRTLGTVAYARQTGPGGDIGNDFGVVEIPASLHSLIRPAMPVWLGPTGARSEEGFGTPVVHYGNGIDAGTVFVTKGRTGTSLNDGIANSWQANILINGGDSGSAINHAAASADSDVLRGTDALGIITHGLIVPGVPLGWGTTIARAKAMATEANLQLVMLREGDTVGGNAAPTASFANSCAGLTCNFDGRASSDSDGTIASYAWNFGDAATGTGATPSHTYAAAGTYTVVLTVTDNGGATDQESRAVMVSSSGITLSARGYKVQGVQHADLDWAGATGANVDIVRDGAIVATTANDGEYTDNIGKKGGGYYEYEVCQAGTAVCSNTVTVTF